MGKCPEYSEVCQVEFRSIHEKLDRMDQAIRGNGQLGLVTRVDRLEQTEMTRRKLRWLATGAALTFIVALVLQLVFGGR